MGKRRSLLQKSHTLSNLSCIKNPRTILETPHVPEIHLLSSALTKEKIANSDFARRLKNQSRQLSRARSTNQKLREEKKRVRHAAQVQKSRAVIQKENAVRKALNRANSNPRRVLLKENGVVKDSCRGMLRDLTSLNVPVHNASAVVSAVMEGFGIEVMDSVSRRTVSRTVKEGGIAAELQIVHEVRQSEGITLSSDGTTLKHRNLESQHGSWTASDYQNGGKKQVTRTFGISMSHNHTSETQLHTWKQRIESLINTYNSSPLNQGDPGSVQGFAASIIGLMTDHANDQKKLSRLLKNWKIESKKALLGEEYMKVHPLPQLLPTILEENNKKIEAAGGLIAWERLSDVEKQLRDQVACDNIRASFGEAAWNELTPDARSEASLFVWAGCAMHKDLNAVKSGAQRMSEFWVKNNLTGPVKLMNKANSAASATNEPQAAEQALQASQGGAVKLTSIAGFVLQHHDEKRGQQDTYHVFFELELGFPVPRFPETSNTRFGSHGDAASELLVHLPLFLEFLLMICDKKDSRSLNNMEYNMYLGLQDIPTLTELVVLALYSQSVSHPYIRRVRASGQDRVNAIGLGPLHQKVKAHCRDIISKPSLLLGADANFKTACLDGENWTRPEVFYSVQRISQQLPHLQECLISFFQGALDAWIRFSTEFDEGGVIAHLSEVEKDRLFIPATNDANESLLGQRRMAYRRAPSETIAHFNARTLYKTNDTKAFINSNLTAPEMHTYLRKTARDRDESGEEKSHRIAQAVHDQEVVERKRKRDVEAEEKRQGVERELDAVQPILDTSILLQKRSDRSFTSTVMIQQFDWHRRFNKDVLPKTLIRSMSRDDKLTNLITTVEWYNRQPQPIPRVDITKRSKRQKLTNIPVVEDWEDKFNDEMVELDG